MIIRVQPDQIREKWHVVRPLILDTLPPQIRISGVAMSNILKGLTMEKGQLWLLYSRPDEEEDQLPKGVIVTTIIKDPLTGARSLAIYSFYAVDKMDRDDYIEGITGLKKFAQETQCSEVVAYVTDDRFVRRLEKMIGARKITNVVRF